MWFFYEEAADLLKFLNTRKTTQIQKHLKFETNLARTATTRKKVGIDVWYKTVILVFYEYA